MDTELFTVIQPPASIAVTAPPGAVQEAHLVAGCIRSMASRVTVLDQKQKVEAANRLQQRWQRWELSNYEYLMLVRPWRRRPLARLLFNVGLFSLVLPSLTLNWCLGSGP